MNHDFYLYPSNRDFVSGKNKKLTLHDEIYYNLNQQGNMTADAGNRGCLGGCMLPILIFFICLTLTSGVYGFYSYQPPLGVLMALFFFALSLMSLYECVRFIRQDRLARTRFNMLFKGVIVKGIVLEVSKSSIGNQITFTLNPDDNLQLKCYETMSYNIPLEGNEIKVLYWAEDLYIVL